MPAPSLKLPTGKKEGLSSMAAPCISLAVSPRLF